MTDQKKLHRPIALVGFMGVGKTSVGKQLAKNLSVEFLDTDTIIEKKTNRTINEIFSEKGEEWFRELEHNVIKEVFDETPRVIATGGGVYCYPRNREIIDFVSTSIMLKSSAQTIFQRTVLDQTRPLLKKNKTLDQIQNLLTQREKAYSLAKYCFRTDGEQTLDELLETIERTVIG